MTKAKSYTVEEIKRKLERYCVYQDRCHQEVEKKLLEFRLIPQAKEHILLHLLEHNFLNEERFSKSFARGKFRIKKWGKQRIVNELKRRNISAYNIKTALREIDEDVYIDTLRALIAQKRESIALTDPYKKRQKIYSQLIYKGYESSLIIAQLDQ